MLPSILAGELQQGVGDFLRTTFPSSTPRFHGMLEAFLARGNGSSAGSEGADNKGSAEPGGALFKGPYVSLKLPFATGDSGPEHYPQVPLDFPPYAHQARAFERIEAPRHDSTLVATGTGSGKTEAFLWPILEHVRAQQQDAPGPHAGIKALLIYPMNALANDQAGRLAEAVDAIEALSDVRVGLYVGQRGAERGGTMRMTPDEVITDREALRLSPPDVLMTNYKMLDYLLTRPRDQALWQHNDPETLRYLVVDELHTFDGAQGTDLACLLRRLKSRLGTPEGHLCCVGTSATLGSGAQDAGQLRQYAEDVFGESVGDDALIGEERVAAEDFLTEATAQRLPTPAEIDAVATEPLAEQEALVAAHYPLWFGSGDAPSAEEVPSDDWRLRLGRDLRGHVAFHHLLDALDGEPQSLAAVADALAARDERWARHTLRQQQRALEGFLALVAWARGEVTDRHGERRLRPLVDVRLQVWLRELRRMVASVDAEDPSLAFWDDLSEEQQDRHLPVVHCLDCGAMGWVGRRRRREQQLRPELQAIYRDFFDGAPTFDFAFPQTRESDLEADGRLEGQVHQLCGHDLAFSPVDADACEGCGRGDNLQRVFVPDNRRTTQDDRQVGVKHCPYCNSQNSLMIVGSRAASLTSVLISQLFASSFNADKKLITFSDAVQDAAHRAGFFEARTFRFNLRAAIQQFVEARETEGLPLTLDEVAAGVAGYWQEQMGDAPFAATFIAPDMQWFRDFEHLREQSRLPSGSNLPRDVARRVSWEAWSEYGFRARIGRTLEKSGASVAAVDPARLRDAAEHILPRLQNEIGALRALSGEAVEAFLRQLVTHRKNQGGIFHPELRGYVEGGGNGYVISGQHRAYMPNYGRFARLPAFIAERSTNRFDPVVSQDRNWLAACAVKHFGDMGPLLESQLGRLYALVLGGLVEANVMDKRSTSRAGTVWGLRPDALHIRTDVAQLRCRRCGHRTSVASGARAAWTGSPCLRYECPGAYGDPRGSGGTGSPNYYRRLYRHSALRRVVAREHTGLLDRPTREQLEHDFKREEERAWDPNVLSCTPTLEMGVDIGALSAVFLCSVPPAPSNFVQRVGRAGRRSGNALDVTVAGGQPHDLYYFADPKAMIAGHVEPPGVFLGAVAVLFRQFAAFCFDEWVSEDLSPGAVPSKLRRVLSNLDDPEGGGFPHNWLAYVEEHEDDLLASFLDLFEEVLSEERAAVLRAMVRGDGDEAGTRVRVLNELNAVRERRRSVQRRSRQLQRDLRALEDGAGPVGDAQEKERDELKREKKAMQRLFRRIGDAETFGFFTHAGLLPNYAFPEKGVTLRSILYRAGSEEGESSDGSVWDEEYVRPAPRAITELAPGNHFYAEGRKVQIDQVALDGEDALQMGRLCDRCGHVAPSDAEAERAACPRCGSPHWSDTGQQRALIRMEEVMATTSVRSSRIDDSSDSRSPAFYDTKLLTSVDRDQVEHAYEAAGDDAAFGYEFVRKATFREVNFGAPAPQPQMTVGGQEIHGKGFALCPDCGRVEKQNGDIDHTRSCRVHRSDHAEEQRKRPFLYREVTSEALRILLPEGTLDASTQRLRSFRAALMMGLEEVFSGTVRHLKATVQETPDASELAQRRYLVLYDAVPGGTGYLAELSRSEGKLMDVFAAARRVLKACPCRHDPDKDGCYQCLYAYRDSYHLPKISRREALTQLRNVLDQRGHLVETDTIDNISLNPLVDSVLERRFLNKLGDHEATVALDEKPIRGKTGYVLHFGEQRYEIEPQVTLGPEDGVARALSVDFMIRPQQAEAHGRPIAVFLDGLQYHRERIGRDLAQRRALQASGTCRVWSLTWEDLEEADSQQPTRNFLTFDAPPFGALLGKTGETRSGTAREIASESSFAWLARYLEAPDAAFWQRLALVQALLWARAEWDDALSALPPGLTRHLRETTADDDVLRGTASDDAPLVRVWAGAPAAQIQQLSEAPEEVAASVVTVVCFDDETAGRQGVLKETWNGVLRLHNLLQFLPDAHVVTSSGDEAFTPYDDLLFSGPAGDDLRDWLPSDGTDGRAGEESDDWARVMEYALDETVEVLQALRAAGAPPPQVPPCELTAESGRIDGVIELAWPAPGVGIALPADEESISAFEARGWTVWPLAQVRQDLEALVDALTEDDAIPATN